MTRNSLLTAVILFGGSVQAQAVPLADAADDFIPSFIGPQGADLDVLASEVFVRSGSFDFTATLNGAIGTTLGGFYVFGVDRGMGTARFGDIATNVLFDAVVVINNNGTGLARDLISGVVTNLEAGAITFNGNSLSAIVDAAALPGQGFDAASFTYNLWPRSPGAGNAFIADFAPDNANSAVTAVPEPASWALLIAGFGLVGTVARRRRTVFAA